MNPEEPEPAAALDALYAARAETVRRVQSLTQDFAAVVDASVDSNTDDEHDPEGPTVAFERAQIVAILDSARMQISEIDTALARIAAGTYGRCAVCGDAMPPQRLRARPFASSCVPCSSHRAR